jgi:hypothetical protein
MTAASGSLASRRTVLQPCLASSDDFVLNTMEAS